MNRFPTTAATTGAESPTCVMLPNTDRRRAGLYLYVHKPDDDLRGPERDSANQPCLLPVGFLAGHAHLVRRFQP